MSDTLSRVKLQLRPVNGSVLNGNGIGNGGDEKTPSSPATKLLINHGKPNYTIQRSPKAQQNGGTNPLNGELQNNNRNNYYPYKSAGVKGNTGIFTNGNTAYKTNGNAVNNNNNNNNSSNSSQSGDEIVIQSTKFNGVFKPANLQHLESKDEIDNPVVLRRVPKVEATPAATENGNDENVPEFILRQRRIQERLAKENILDFESRRSGYFTHVVISPTSPNRTSLVETMSSPPIVPALEIPPPAKESREASIVEENSGEVSEANGEVVPAREAHEEQSVPTSATNGQVEEEEVAKAIEEVNKAVAGEVDDEKTEEVVEEDKSTTVVQVEVEDAATTTAAVEHKEVEQESVEQEKAVQHEVHPVRVEETHIEEAHTPVVSVVVTSASLAEAEAPQEAQPAIPVVVEPAADVVVESPHKEEIVVVAQVEAATEVSKTEDELKENGHAVAVAVQETNKTNGNVAEDVTISHTNGLANGYSTPNIPNPDPSGALGVNYEPKTVVSFSKDLGAPNKYPDTVKVVKTNEADGGENNAVSEAASDELKELAKLKFDIKADDQDVQVTPVLRSD